MYLSASEQQALRGVFTLLARDECGEREIRERLGHALLGLLRADQFASFAGPVNAIQGVALLRQGAGCKAPARSKASALQARATPQTAPWRSSPEGSSPEPAPRRCPPSVCGRTRGVARLDGQALASFATP
ncbi:hypothetical protein ACEN9J_23855 [Variovorax sp. Varisp41]|uniref:hypothetical protein n=1 Tax=Variovorax sp. Varisp41 TaxID=3243033 RepID=UPI0039B49D9A